MSATFKYRTLIDDFVFGDRRLGDRPDVRIVIGPLGRDDLKPGEDRIEPPGMVFGCGNWKVELALTAPPLRREFDHVRVLIQLLRYSEREVGRSNNPISRPEYLHLIKDLAMWAIGIGQSTEDIVFHEAAAPIPFTELIEWCRAAGFFCPTKTAIVRVIDISPELLRALKENPEILRRLRPDQFESLVADRLDRMGFDVKLTGPTTRRDGGIDVIAVPRILNAGSFVLAAQVKHHQGEQKTGREAVDRLASWNGPFRLGMLVTNTSFTKDAVWTAAQERNRDFIRLRDFNDLKRWLQDQYGEPEDWREIPDKIELASGIVIEVPKPRLY